MPAFGLKDDFAIEYDLEVAYPPYGRLRLWLKGSPVGRFGEPWPMYHTFSTLRALVARNFRTMRCVRDSLADLPDPHDALDEDNGSWGEAHDDHDLAIFVVKHPEVVVLFWRTRSESNLQEDRWSYPALQHRISWQTFDDVVGRAVASITREIAASSGRTMSFD